jgi:hypothetical protein
MLMGKVLRQFKIHWTERDKICLETIEKVKATNMDSREEKINRRMVMVDAIVGGLIQSTDVS